MTEQIRSGRRLAAKEAGKKKEEKKKKPFGTQSFSISEERKNIRAAATLVPVTGVKAELSDWCGHSSGLMSSLMSSLLGRSLICSSAGCNYRTAAVAEVPLVVWWRLKWAFCRGRRQGKK